MNRKIKKYGWRPQLPDIRDKVFKLTAPIPVPDKVDLSVDLAMPPVYDQGDVGSCTANSVGALFEFELRKQNLVDFMPSR